MHYSIKGQHGHCSILNNVDGAAAVAGLATILFDALLLLNIIFRQPSLLTYFAGVAGCENYQQGPLKLS